MLDVIKFIYKFFNSENRIKRRVIAVHCVFLFFILTANFWSFENNKNQIYTVEIISTDTGLEAADMQTPPDTATSEEETEVKTEIEVEDTVAEEPPPPPPPPPPEPKIEPPKKPDPKEVIEVERKKIETQKKHEADVKKRIEEVRKKRLEEQKKKIEADKKKVEADKKKVEADKKKKIEADKKKAEEDKKKKIEADKKKAEEDNKKKLKAEADRLKSQADKGNNLKPIPGKPIGDKDTKGNGSNEVKNPHGNGSGAPVTPFNYANYYAEVKDRMDFHWDKPEGMGGQEIVVNVTVDRAGNILERSIKRKSGDLRLDNSVIVMLNALKSLPPLPAISTDKKLNFDITFSLKN